MLRLAQRHKLSRACTLLFAHCKIQLLGSREGRVDMTAPHYFIAWLHFIRGLEVVRECYIHTTRINRVM
jgi:hypothetical protein